MSKMTKSTLALAIITCLTTPASNATNGMFLIGNGAKSTAMGGTAIANPLDSLSGASNPATISGMKNRFDIGMDLFYVNAESQLGSISAKSEASVNIFGTDNLFMMPAMGITYQYTSDITLGFSMTPTGGGGTKFTTNFYETAAASSPDTPNINKKLGVDLLFMEMNPTVAFKIDEINSVGFALVIGIARFNAYGLDLFDTFTQTQGTLDNFSNQGKDWTGGAGARIGWFGDYGDLKLGAAYTSKVYMDEFNRYTELFAEQGDLDIPAIASIGMSYKITQDLLIAMDVTYTFYEDVRSIANAGPNITSDSGGVLDPATQTLGLDGGLGFSWENQTVIKLGTAYNLSTDMILRAGWNYGKSPIDEDRDIIFNLLAPASTQHHLTLGGTYKLSPDMELNASFMHAFEYEQAGPTYISDDGSNYGRLSMSQTSLGLSFAMNF